MLNLRNMHFLKSIGLSLCFIGFSLQAKAQNVLSAKPGSPEPMNITVHYLVRPPFVIENSNPNGAPSGVEGEVFQKFIEWLRVKKRVQVQANYKSYNQFESFYETVKAGKPNDIGFGNVTITDARSKEVQFSPAYLKSISVLVTPGNIPTITSNEELKERLSKLTGITSTRSVHAVYMDELRAKHLPNLGMEFVNDQNGIPRKIALAQKHFGYVDIITYWYFMKESSHFLKIHRFLSRGNERMGFIMPTESNLMPYVLEFFESGFGFTATKNYRDILEKYLGYEIISTVEVN